jgi:hypothetical protein
MISEMQIQKMFRLVNILRPYLTRKEKRDILKQACEVIPKLRKDHDRKQKARKKNPGDNKGDKKERLPESQWLPDEALLIVAVIKTSKEWKPLQDHQPTADDLLVDYLKAIIWHSLVTNSLRAALAIGHFLYSYKREVITQLAPDYFTNDNILRVEKDVEKKVKALFPVSALSLDENDNFIRVAPSARQRELISKFMTATAEFWPSDTFSHARDVNFLDEYFSEEKVLAHLEWERTRVVTDVNNAGFPRLISEYNDSLTRKSAMKPDTLRDKLLVPQFKVGRSSGDENDRLPPGSTAAEDRFNLKQLDDVEVELIQTAIRRNESREKEYRLGPLRVYLDGKEFLRFELGKQFEVPSTATYLEIHGEDDEGELLLDIFRLPDWESLDDKERKICIWRKRGQKIWLALSPRREETGEVSGLIQVTSSASNKFFAWFPPPGILVYASVIGLILGLIGVGLYVWRLRPAAQPVIVKEKPGPIKIEPEKTPAPPRRQPSPPAIRPHTRGSHYGVLMALQDKSGIVSVGRDGTVRLADGATLPKSLSKSVLELVRTNWVTPDQDVSVGATTLQGDSTKSALRNAQGAAAPLPIPVSPVLTAIRSTAPTLRWGAVPGTEEYKIRVAFPAEKENGRIVWEGSAGSRTQVALPAGVLQQGEGYLWQVEAIVDDQSRLSPIVGFQVLNSQALRKVRTAERSYKNSALVLASVYEAHGLYEEALAQVERLAKMNPTNPKTREMLDSLRHQLGKE